MKIVEELKAKLESANRQTVEELQRTEDPVYWFLLLAKYPQFAPHDDWWFNLRNYAMLPWSKLLSTQPQFEKYCHWESVSRLDLLLLSFKAPEIFKKKFPEVEPLTLYDFLTPLEKTNLLIEEPSLEKWVNWNELSKQLTIGNWFSLLAYQPLFEKYFDWSKVEKQPNYYWSMLLLKQPQFAIHCNLDLLYPWQQKKLLKYQPQIFEI